MYGQKNVRMLFNILLPLLLLLTASCGRSALSPEAEALLSQLKPGGDLIVAQKIKGELPLDPLAEVWQEAEEFVITLVPQRAVVPRAPLANKTKLSVRALHNKKDLGLLLTWKDLSQDVQETGAELFRDAAAVGIPMHYGATISLPYIGMGSKESPVNIWHWKASWQNDLDQGFQGVAAANAGMVPNVVPTQYLPGRLAGSPLAQEKRESPVENLLAEGFGTLTSAPVTGLAGKGVWQNGRWQLVIKRPRSATGSAADLGRRGLIPLTFAIWDGRATERNGIKGITRWRFLHFSGEDVSVPFLQSLVTHGVVGGDKKRGEGLVTQVGCVQCHSLPGSPAVGGVGPDLNMAGAIHRPEYLLESITNPNAVIVPAPGYYDPTTWTSTMPSYEGALQEQDYKDMAEYLWSLQ